MSIFSPITSLFGGGKNSQEKDLYKYFFNTITPTIQTNYAIGQQRYDAGRDIENKALGNIDYLTNYFKKFLEGGDSSALLDFIDQQGLNERFDANSAAIAELTPRGGRRASILGNEGFEKATATSNLINQVRQKSPDAIAQLSQLLAQMAGQDFSASQSGWQNVLSSLGLSLEPYEKQKDRKTAIINSIIGGASSAAGFYFGSK